MKGIRGRITAATALGAASVLAAVALPPDRGARADGSCTGTACPAMERPGVQRPAVERPHTLPALVAARPDVPRTPEAAAAAARTAVRSTPDACGSPYVKDHGELGPAHLPRVGYFGSLVRGYVRYGGLSPAKFITRYWDETANPAYWRYPPDLGFAHSGGWSNGRVLRERETLPQGSLLDRFGSPYGTFLAPAGSAFGARALPPDSLNTKSSDPSHLCNYHLYRVSRAFDVDAGPIAPAFQQRGGGRQYVLMSAYLPGAPSTLNVTWLVANGYLSVIY